MQALVIPKPTKKGQVYFGRFYLGKRRRIPGGSGVARDPKAVVGSPGNTLWEKMPNMSTVAILVSYCLRKIIDITSKYVH